MASYVSATSQPLPPPPHPPLPLTLCGPLHMLSIRPRIPSLNFLTGQTLAVLQNHAELSHHTEQPAWARGGSCSSPCPRMPAPGCKRSSCENWFLATARNDSRGVERQEGLGVTLCKKSESHAKVPGIWTGRPVPDPPLSSSMRPGGSSPNPGREIMEAQTPESGGRTTGQILTLMTAPINSIGSGCVGCCVEEIQRKGDWGQRHH